MEAKVSVIQAWADDYHNGSLRTDNETAREQAYNRDLFGSILGYTQKPSNPHSFEPKSSTASGQIPDARIGYFDTTTGVDRTIAVLELKGANVSLDRPQRGHSNLSPVQQGFKYRPQYRGCEFVIVSNFYELRLYNDNQLDFDRWTLDDLIDPSQDYLNFRLFHLILHADNFVAEQGKSATQDLLIDIRVQQEAIGNEFYVEYREARATLISNLWLMNESVQQDRALGIEKAQKIIDRIVFACFAEDRGLLPDRAVARVIREAADSSFGSLWSTFRAFFDAIDRGSSKLGIAVGYNGGLFARDEILDGMIVGDNALRAVANLSTYNFVQDLSVSILGHIFEQSITDLENIRIAGDNPNENPLSRRKRDGIYYTPDHVVRFIVDQSLGAHLRTVEANFLAESGLTDGLNSQTYAAREKAGYLRYREYLHNVRVLDPACGSGAFLVQALDFLLAENQRVAAILGPDMFSNDDFVKIVLQQNLYGVDLNEESVEITKLSLWLKTAKKGRPLTALDGNIRCGNSLLGPTDGAIDHAFDWAASFPSIVADGGFHTVLGNPPYVDSEVMVRSAPEERSLIAATFESASGNWDLFVPFYQRAFDLTRVGGVCSMIVPNKILGAPYASTLRGYIAANGQLLSIVDVSREHVFDVDVYPVIVTTRKPANPEAKTTVLVQSGIGSEAEPREVEADDPEDWARIASVASADRSVGVPLRSLFEVGAAASVAEAYALRDVLFEDPHAASHRIINTGTIDPYTNDWGLWPMTYIKGRFLFPAVSSANVGKTKVWHDVDKVVVAGMSKTIEGVFVGGSDFLPAKSTVVVYPKTDTGLSAYVALALLNSAPFRSRFVSANQYNAMAGGFITISQQNLGSAMAPLGLLSRADSLDALARTISEEHSQLKALSGRLKTLLEAEFGAGTWTGRLRGWWNLDFTKFCKALGKSMSLSKKSELAVLHSQLSAEARTREQSANVARSQIDASIEALFELESEAPA